MNVFHLTTCSLFRCHLLCCCLLSRVSGMIVQFLSVWLVRKSTQLTVHQEHTFLILHWTKQQSPVLDIHSSGEIDQRNSVQDVLFLVTGSPAKSASEYPVMCFKVVFKSFGFNAGIVRYRFSSRVPFKYLNTFLARVKSASVGDASLYDKHFVANIKSGLTLVMYCSFPTTPLNNEC